MIRHKKVLRKILFLVYILAAFAGIAMIFLRPLFEYGRFGQGIVMAAGVLILGGAAPALWASWAPAKRWQTERWASPLIASGATMYSLAVLNLVVMSNPSRAAHAILALIVAASTLYRAVEVDRIARNHREEWEEDTVA